MKENNAYNPFLHRRRSIRLPGYDYTQAGLYFITICVQHRLNLFGSIVSDPKACIMEIAPTGERAPTRGAPTNNTVSEYVMQFNAAGKMIEDQWLKLPERFPGIVLHEYVVMPNHFHGIIEIMDSAQPNQIVGAPLVGALPFVDTQPQNIKQTVGEMIGAFKSVTTNEYMKGVNALNWQPFKNRLWQRNFWEHIIRSEKSYDFIADYIRNNAANWPADKLNPQYPPK